MNLILRYNLIPRYKLTSGIPIRRNGEVARLTDNNIQLLVVYCIIAEGLDWGIADGRHRGGIGGAAGKSGGKVGKQEDSARRKILLNPVDKRE
jgi:hypothetical protein